MLRLNAKCRDVDWQYEINNNNDLDNGVFNKFAKKSLKENDQIPDESSSVLSVSDELTET